MVPVGIQHGYRPVGPDAFMIIGGAKAPVLRPCLENTVLDLSAVDDPRLGTEVILLGSEGSSSITLTDLARWQHSSPLAMLTSLSEVAGPRAFLGG